MKNIPDNLNPQQAWEILSSIPRLIPISKSVVDACGLCLSKPFLAPENIPAGNRSFMDGFAVRSSDVKDVPAQLHLSGEILMGQGSTGRLAKGAAISIPTGGFLPEDADAVVMQEDTVVTDDLVTVHKSVQKNENIQLCGEDFRKDMLLFPSNHRLRPQDLSTIATFGISSVSVFPKPKVAILSTGNELVPFDGPADYGKIRETNALALATALEAFHFDAFRHGIIPDEFADQKNAMNQALQNADVVLVSGGSSVGARDYTLEVIRSFPDHKIHFHGLAIRPGNPTIFATIGSRAVFGLPGQPVSSLIVFFQFVLPFLFHFSGSPVHYESFHESHFPCRTAKLSHPIQPLKIKTDYVRLKLEQKDSEWIATPVLGKSASLSTLALANGFTIIPPASNPIPEGTNIKVILFP